MSGRWQAIYLSLCLSVGAVFLVFDLFGLSWNLTTSLPQGLWINTGAFKATEANRGQVVKFCPPDTAVFRQAREDGILRRGRCGGDYMPLLKRVMGLPGDVVQVSDHVTINGVSLPYSKLQPRISKRYRIDDAWLKLKDREVWLMGDTDDSFDSRYFGKAHIENVLNREAPAYVLREIDSR